MPAAPTVEPATTGLFTTLQIIFQPKVIHDASRYYWIALGVGAICFLIICQRRRGESWLALLLFCFFLIVISGLLLPALGTAGMSVSTSNVNVIERKTVGIYETATISSRDGEALLTWLTQNGFATPTNFVPAIRAYAQEGWFFVASKIRLDVPLTESAKPHPLAFRFKTDRPVYPLRLTGIGNEKCKIDLYVFGPGEAALPHFAVERCAEPVYPAEQKEGFYRTLDKLRIRHPLLRELVDQAPVATKLTGELDSHQMEQDGYLTWSPFQDKRLTLYTNQGASETGADISVPILVLALLLWYIYNWSEAPSAIRFRKMCACTVLAALALWAGIYLLLPKTPAFVTTMPTMRNRMLHRDIPLVLNDEFTRSEGQKGGNFKPDLAWVRQQLSETLALRKDFPPQGQRNVFTGQPWHEEDSPGNYTLRESDFGIEYIWYDIDGGTNVVSLFDEKK